MSMAFGGDNDPDPHTMKLQKEIEEARVQALAELSDEAFMQEMERCAMEMKAGHPGAREKMMRLGKSQAEHLAKYISDELPGVTGILNRRRLAYSIPDGAFEHEAVFDRILLFQVPRHAGETFEDSVLVKPEHIQQREEEENPCGIIISAGLPALDALRSHGMDIGHLVNFARLSPNRICIASVRGMEVYLLILRVGDIIASMDLPHFRAKGKVVTKAFLSPNGGVEHRLVDPNKEDARPLAPTMPWISMDY